MIAGCVRGSPAGMSTPSLGGTLPGMAPTVPNRAEELADRVRRARAGAGPGDETMLQDLETAYEELRVPDERARAQEEHIARLLRLRESHRLMHERMLAVLPVAVVVTDRNGAIRTVNAATAQLVGQRPERLVHKPVFVLFDAASRRDLRTLLAHLGSDDSAEQSVPARAAARDGRVTAVDVMLSLDRDDGKDVSWLLVPRAHTDFAGALARLAALPVRGRTADQVLHDMAALCRAALGEGVEVTLALGGPSEPEALASTGQLAQRVDGLQIAAAAGPCVDAHEQREVVWTDDLTQDERWPTLAAMVPDAVGAVVAAPLVTHGTIRGVLNAYRPAPGADASLREAVETVALTVAAILQERDLEDEVRRVADDMQQALRSRATIDQAKGIVMAQKGGTPEEAFQHLRDLASTQHVKLRDLAQTIVARAQERAH